MLAHVSSGVHAFAPDCIVRTLACHVFLARPAAPPPICVISFTEVIRCGPVSRRLTELFTQLLAAAVAGSHSPRKHSGSLPDCTQDAARLLLSTLTALRHARLACWRRDDDVSPRARRLALPLDYLLVARAANAVGCPHTALLHTELWCMDAFGVPALHGEAGAEFSGGSGAGAGAGASAGHVSASGEGSGSAVVPARSSRSPVDKVRLV
jgi:hypothetical protein